MLLRNVSILKPIIAVLAMAMLAVALACASDEPEAEPHGRTHSHYSGRVYALDAGHTAHGYARAGPEHGGPWLDGTVLAEPGLRRGVGTARKWRDLHIRGTA